MECGPLVLREEVKLKKVTWGLIFFSKGAGRNGGGRGGQATFSCTRNPITELYLGTLQTFFNFSFLFFNF